MAETTTELTTTQQQTTTDSNCEEEATKIVRTRRRGWNADIELIEDLLQQAAEHFKTGKQKVTVTDFVRLMQVLKELKEEQPEEVRVTWVEPEDESVTAT